MGGFATRGASVIAELSAVSPLIRRLGHDDLDRIMAIELASYPYPWTRGIFKDCIDVGYDCWGLQGVTGLWGYSVHTHAAGECHLLNLCITPEHQRSGYGGVLLGHVTRLARLQGCNCMFLEVRPSNPAGISLYRKNGFLVVGERRDYYTMKDGKENAIVMRLEL